MPPTSPDVDVNWTDLVERIRRGETSGMEKLYRIFSKGIRYMLLRSLGHEGLDDKVHDAFVTVVQSIQQGYLREPERLMGFVQIVVRRQIVASINDAVQTRQAVVGADVSERLVDRRCNAEESLAYRQRVDLMKAVLRELPDRDREVLIRFYLNEQHSEEICAEMGLTDTQFRLLKSRAKARFGELGKKRLRRGPFTLLSLGLGSKVA